MGPANLLWPVSFPAAAALTLRPPAAAWDMETVADVAKYQPHLHLPQQRNHYLRWAAGRVQKCRAVQWILHLLKRSYKHVWNLNSVDLGIVFRLRVFSHHVWRESEAIIVILKDCVNCWLELSALQEIYTGSWKICCWFSTRSETHSLNFTCFNIKSQAKERNNKPKKELLTLQ